MPCNRNKRYTHTRSELMLAVKKALGWIDWGVFERATAKNISDLYYLPIGSPTLYECVAVRRARCYWDPPPTIELYSIFDFQRAYIKELKPKRQCVVCDDWFDIEHLWFESQFCRWCKKLDDQGKMQKAIGLAELELKALAKETRNEQRNERECKRVASREAAE